jgi:hypothetical protein
MSRETLEHIGAQPKMHLRVFECGVCTSENLERLTELQKMFPTLSKVGHKFGGGIFSFYHMHPLQLHALLCFL